MDAHEFPTHDSLMNRMTLADCVAEGYSFFGWCGKCPDFVDVRSTDLLQEADGEVLLRRLRLRHEKCGTELELRIHPVQFKSRLSLNSSEVAVSVAA